VSICTLVLTLGVASAVGGSGGAILVSYTTKFHDGIKSKSIRYLSIFKDRQVPMI
jgi:hypothetical protein